MSYQALEAAMGVRCSSLATFAVLMRLAHHHNWQTGACFPSGERIAEEANISLSSVRRAIKELKDDGVIRITKGHREGSYNASNRYVLVFLQQGQLDALGRPTRIHAYREMQQADRPTVTPKKGTSSSLRSEESGSKRRRSQRRPVKLRMTEDWALTKTQRAKTVEMGLPDDGIERLLFRFINHGMSTGDVRANWLFAWYNWVQTEVEKSNGGEGQANRRTDAGGWRDQREASLRAFEESGGVDLDEWVNEGPRSRERDPDDAGDA